MKKTFRIYGSEGHRLKESFCPSYAFTTRRGTAIIDIIVANSDITGTNDYSVIFIAMADFGSESEIEQRILCELRGQIEDGVFENSKVGKVVDNETGEQVKLWG